MFIKKDLRKIPKIMEDAVECMEGPDYDGEQSTTSAEPRVKRSKVETPLSVLRLGRRQQEFQGSVKILCQPHYIPKLQCLQNLNLYDCAITSLDGIGILKECRKLEILNMGRNPLTSLPEELSALSGSLKELWLDDCHLTGPLPHCVTQLENLESFRAPNNRITHIPDAISRLQRLKVLCLDRNPLEALPENLHKLKKLEELYLRHTNIRELPLRLPTRSLKILHLSSNPLTNVDRLLVAPGLQELTHLYLNGCQLISLPPGIVSKHPKLKRLVVSHNPPLRHAPIDLWHAIRGKELVPSTADIVWQPNPQLIDGITEAPQDDSSSEDETMEGVELSRE